MIFTASAMILPPSMKVPPKRKGNFVRPGSEVFSVVALNESPSEKEGKCPNHLGNHDIRGPSMKVPPKRKGNVKGLSLKLRH